MPGTRGLKYQDLYIRITFYSKNLLKVNEWYYTRFGFTFLRRKYRSWNKCLKRKLAIKIIERRSCCDTLIFLCKPNFFIFSKYFQKAKLEKVFHDLQTVHCVLTGRYFRLVVNTIIHQNVILTRTLTFLRKVEGKSWLLIYCTIFESFMKA